MTGRQRARFFVSVVLPSLVLALAAFTPLAIAQPPTAPAASASASPPPPPPPPAPAPARAAASGAPTRRSFTDAIPCSTCHTTTAWRAKGGSGEEAKFDHSTTGFPLTGQHMHASCVSCHNATRTSTSIKRACVSCHDDFHRGRLSRSCDNCHSAVGWKTTRPLEIHRMTRFPLTGMHVLADCTECHRRASEHRWTEAPIDCATCHEKDFRRPNLRPVHQGDATTAPFPRDCSMCHQSLAWVPAVVPLTFTKGSPLRTMAVAPPQHDVRFPISFGIHRTATCDDCHSSLATTPRAVRCIGCHAHDPVRLMQQHRQAVGTDGAACLSCHPGGARR